MYTNPATKVFFILQERDKDNPAPNLAIQTQAYF